MAKTEYKVGEVFKCGLVKLKCVDNIGELAKGYKEGFREGVNFVVEKVEKSINSKNKL